jgi:hypothetical protein
MLTAHDDIQPNNIPVLQGKHCKNQVSVIPINSGNLLTVS